MWEYEAILDNYFLPICIWKCWRNIREISPPPLPSVSCLPTRGDPTCSLTLPTDLTDNYFLFIGGYLHASTCLFVGFFLLVCVGFECFGGVDFSNDPLTIMKSCFPSFWNSESRKLHLAYCLPNSPRSRLISWLPMQQLPKHEPKTLAEPLHIFAQQVRNEAVKNQFSKQKLYCVEF